MEIRAQYLYIIFNLVIIFPNFHSKTFSLNEAIAAEARNQPSIKITRLSDLSTLPERSLFTQPRKNFLIKPPVRPKLLKTRLGSLHQSKQAKRQSDDYAEINPNFLPLFRSLSIILDNIIESDPSEIINLRNKFKRNPSITKDADDIVCKCAYRTSTHSPKSDSYEETVIPTVVASEVETEAIPSATSAPKAYRPTNHNLRNLRWNKSVSLLPARNSPSSRGNSHGLDETSSASNIRHVKRNFTRDQGNNEHDTRNGITKPLAEDSEENSECDTRDGGSCDTFRGERADGTYTRYPIRNTIDEYISASSENDETNIFAHEAEDKLADKGIEGESAELLPEYISRSQRIKPQNKIQSAKAKENDYTAIEQFIPSAERIINRDSTNPTENKKHSRADETIIPNSLTLDNPNNKVVMIFDGYSVARDVNGENKMSEKAIQIHT